MIEQRFCECDRWQFYVTNYYETFYWHHKAKMWYVRWVSLDEQKGHTQVSRYAIPMKFCPLCGGKLKNLEE